MLAYFIWTASSASVAFLNTKSKGQPTTAATSFFLTGKVANISPAALGVSAISLYPLSSLCSSRTATTEPHRLVQAIRVSPAALGIASGTFRPHLLVDRHPRIKPATFKCYIHPRARDYCLQFSGPTC